MSFYEDKKMSKDTPEVGDVFENGYGNKILITEVRDFNNDNSYALKQKL